MISSLCLKDLEVLSWEEEDEVSAEKGKTGVVQQAAVDIQEERGHGPKLAGETVGQKSSTQMKDEKIGRAHV